MIIPAQEIRRRCQIGFLVSPFYERTRYNGMTVGLGPAGYDVRIAESVYIPSGGFTLASTVECFNMPNDLLAQVCDKSSWARKGVFVQNTVIEPGWRGYLTLEITSHHSLTIQAMDAIAQIIFIRLSEPTEQPYKGRYQDQVAGPQPPIEATIDDQK